jgi:hypothetical protein
MKTRTTKGIASTFAAQLTENADAFITDRVSFAEFTSRQGEIWAAIRVAGEKTQSEVLRILRTTP